LTVTAHGFFIIQHTSGTKDVLRASLSGSPAQMDFNQLAIESYDAALSSASFVYRSFSLIRVEAVSAGLHTRFLNADSPSGFGEIHRWHLTAQFFPSRYGTVAAPLLQQAAPSGADPAGIGGQNRPDGR
jgi:hypothetical protein